MIFVDEALLEGAQAYRENKPRDACPYREVHRKAAWQRGWWMQRAQRPRGGSK